MNSQLLRSAVEIVGSPGHLVNMMRLRIRQLTTGHRPLILAPPSMGMADVVLSEIIAGKLVSEAIVVTNEGAPIIDFPSADSAKKQAA